MAIRRWNEVALVRDVASVWETIRKVAATGETLSPRTCWNAVGLYLHQHPDTVGQVWFYGAPESSVRDVVFHAMLTDMRGNVLRDTMQSRGGKPMFNGTHYQVPGSEEMYEMMAWKRWPAKG